MAIDHVSKMNLYRDLPSNNPYHLQGIEPILNKYGPSVNFYCIASLSYLSKLCKRVILSSIKWLSQ